MADYIRRDIVLKIINTVNDTGGFAGYADYCVLFDEIDTMPAADVQEVAMNKTEELIGIFGALCDYMVDNGRCDVFCPYAKTKDKDDECEAWRTIQKIRQEE